MERKVVKAGIAGSGFAARFHYDALQRVFSTKVDVIGVPVYMQHQSEQRDAKLHPF